MELQKNTDHLQTLVRKTWDLRVRIDEIINRNGFGFCSRCLSRVRLCASSFEEREKMIGIRDSLKDVHNILIFLQRMKSTQNRESDEALAHLDESRKRLIERINEYPQKETKNIDVLQELIHLTFVKDNGKDDEFPWNFKIRKRIDENIEEKKKNVNGISSFLLQITRFGLEFVVIFASIYASVELFKSRNKNDDNNNRLGMSRVVAPMDSSIHLDVLCGRG